MTIDYQKLRLDGIYLQDQDGHLMLRIKIPAGVLSSVQAAAIGAIAEAQTNGRLHLTTRGSIELHWLRYEQLPEIFRALAAVGLSSRGACGGAVRGISCSTTFSRDFPKVQAVARRLNRHFAGNPHFEGLPKKFKIGIDAGYAGARHLIQDVGLVYVDETDEQKRFDVWCAGGLGREPQAGFLLEQKVPEHRLIPLIEAVVQVYRRNTPPPKRLKFLLNQLGESAFRELLQQELAGQTAPQPQQTLEGPLTHCAGEIVEIPVFAGELTSSDLRVLAKVAEATAGGFLAVTTDQNIALALQPGLSAGTVFKTLAEQGLQLNAPEQQVNFRICPGSHECRMGLVATRDVARTIIQQMTRAVSDTNCGLSWAISGCPNSCSQPQLADIGIVTSKLEKTPDGERTALFDLYRRSDAQLGQPILERVPLAGLLAAIKEIR